MRAWRRLLLPTLLWIVAVPAGGHAVAGSVPPEPAAAADGRALEILERRLTAQPGHLPLRRRAARRWLEHARRTRDHDDFLVAIRHFGAWLDASPGAAPAWVGLGQARAGRHDFAGALEAARHAIDLAPTLADGWALLCDAHTAAGHVPDAELACERLATLGEPFDAGVRQALVHALRGRRDATNAALDRAFAAAEGPGAEPRRALVYVLRAEDALAAGATEDARDAFARALALQPGDPAATIGFADATIATGRRPDDALVASLEELAGRTGDPLVGLALGRVLAARGDAHADAWFERAERSMRHALEHGDVGHRRDLAILGIARGAAARREAIGLLERELAEVRQDAETWEWLAWALHLEGRHAEAASAMRRALAPGARPVRRVERSLAIARARRAGARAAAPAAGRAAPGRR